MKPGARGDTMICNSLVDEYIEVAFGTGPMKNESEYSWFHADILKQTDSPLRREPGERDAGRAQLREAADGAWPRAQSESARRKLPSHTAPYIRHFNLFRRHMPRASAREKEKDA